MRTALRLAPALGLVLVLALPPALYGQFVTRDKRWPARGPWMWALPRELPGLYREFNGIDFGHAHIAETLLRTGQIINGVEETQKWQFPGAESPTF